MIGNNYPGILIGQREPNPYAVLDDEQLVMDFKKDRRNKIMAQEVTRRVLLHADMTHNPDTTRLMMKKDGEMVQVQHNGIGLMQSDYIGYAVEKHPYTVLPTLDFLGMGRGSQEYEEHKKIMLEHIAGDNR